MLEHSSDEIVTHKSLDELFWEIVLGVPQGPAILISLLPQNTATPQRMCPRQSTCASTHPIQTGTLGQVNKGVLGLQLSSQRLVTFVHLLLGSRGSCFSSFHSAWGFRFSAQESFSFRGVSFLGWLSANILASN